MIDTPFDPASLFPGYEALGFNVEYASPMYVDFVRIRRIDGRDWREQITFDTGDDPGDIPSWYWTLTPAIHNNEVWRDDPFDELSGGLLSSPYDALRVLDAYDHSTFREETPC